MSASADFLFELGCEELPPKALLRLSQALGDGVRDGLSRAGLAYQVMQLYAAPRRLAVLLTGLQTAQADAVEERRGPALTAAFDGAGNPTPAAQGFARSCGITVERLDTQTTDKGAWLVYRQARPGKAAAELLPDIMQTALDKLPIPKRMRWGSLDVEFVRPVHWVVMLLGDTVIDATIYGIHAGRETRGHRFHHPARMYIAEPAAYAPLLESEGYVMADFAARREAVRAQVLEVAAAVNGQAVIDPELLDEVTAMVEWPRALLGNFEPRFLEVPAEVLISAMKGHQKYFHVTDQQGRLLPHFITVSNIDSRDLAVVRAGNERVIRPRLSDADFFWTQDRKQPLQQRVASLASVVFQKDLGTLADKGARLERLMQYLAGELGLNGAQAGRAAHLAKCDLMTSMVGEFPELQGVMGRYYARHDGEMTEVAEALYEQYLPRFAGDQLPSGALGQALALADKIDTLVGIFWIGELPSGTRDPFALRRAALGILRILVEQQLALDIEQLVTTALHAHVDGARARSGAKQFAAGQTAAAVVDFILERLRGYYQERGLGHDVFEAVLQRRPTRLTDFDQRIRAVAHFATLPEAESLAAANKRIRNILKQTEQPIPSQVDAARLVEPAERVLLTRLDVLEAEVGPLLQQGAYTETLGRLATLREPVDQFFDKVMVMSDDALLRANRLALLARLQRLFLEVADISCLQIKG
ncbi:MAG: glycine--tRNA ligase subunit beta [Gammaproteobacteria bacterium]|nr:glycine--tRNA ligase subunit beta [Gammaproteobacteria bacterium]